MEYDETKAIEFIRQATAGQLLGEYSDDEILNVIDMIWDFYEANGMLEIDDDDDDEDEEAIVSELIDYVNRMLRKDKEATMQPDDAAAVVKAELAYEDSLF